VSGGLFQKENSVKDSPAKYTVKNNTPLVALKVPT